MEKAFDTVDHQILIGKVAKLLGDKYPKELLLIK